MTIDGPRALGAPAMSRHDILCISSIDWDFIWQGHQEIMSTLAADGHRVLFIENTGVRAPTVGDLPRIRKRFTNWWRATKGFREERPNLFVYSPLLLPFPYSRFARWANLFFIRRALRRWMEVTGFRRPLVWTFLPTPLALDLIGTFDRQLTIYYCIDDFVSSSPGARRIVDSERRLFKEADLVFVTSEQLRVKAVEAPIWQRCGGPSSDTWVVCINGSISLCWWQSRNDCPTSISCSSGPSRRMCRR
jgi:hypothetical protein